MRSHPISDSFRSRWQLPVYFQLRRKEIILKLEDALNRVNGVNKATVNFLSQKITLDVEDGKLDEVVKTMVSTAKKIEPDCTILV